MLQLYCNGFKIYYLMNDKPLLKLVDMYIVEQNKYFTV